MSRPRRDRKLKKSTLRPKEETGPNSTSVQWQRPCDFLGHRLTLVQRAGMKRSVEGTREVLHLTPSPSPQNKLDYLRVAHESNLPRTGRWKKTVGKQSFYAVLKHNTTKQNKIDIFQAFRVGLWLKGGEEFCSFLPTRQALFISCQLRWRVH